MTKSTKKILTLLLAIAMVSTMLPLTAAEANGCTHDCSDGTCGYIESADCGHVCGADCGGQALYTSGVTAMTASAEIMPLAVTAGSTMSIGGQTGVSLAVNTGNLATNGWTWTASTNTLTLANNYSGEGIYIECGVSDNITLVLNGDVIINSANWGINVVGISGALGGSLTIKAGSYTLDVTAFSDALQAHGGVVIESGTVVAKGDIIGVCSYYGDVTISGNANLTAAGTGIWSNGIQANGDVIIDTSGTVTVSGAEFCGIAAQGSIQIVNGTVTAKGLQYGALNAANGIIITGGTVTTDNSVGSAGGNVFGSLTVSGGTVSVTGDVTGDLNVSDGTVTVTGTVAGITSVTNGTVSVNGQTIAPNVSITGSMTIGGTAVSDLRQNASGTGWTWTASTATLSLTSSYVNTNPIAINCASTDIINLEYTGNVPITSADDSTLYCNGDLNITGSAGTLTLNSTSSNSLYCAVEVNGVLTVNGIANVSATCAGSGTSPAATVIYAKNGVTVSGGASVTTNTAGTDAGGIWVERGAIAVSTSGTVTANGKGTGGALAIMNGQKFNMSSGNLALTGNPLVGEQFVDINISGGSITIGGTPVYKAELTLSGVSAAARVTAISSPASGYGVSSELTSADGKLCFLLPEGNQTVTLTAGGATYTGTVTVATNHANTATLTTGGDTTNYTVAFDSRGGSTVSDKSVALGGTVAKPSDPTREGYSFTGWYTDTDCATLYDFSTKVTKSFILYAGWKKTITIDDVDLFDDVDGHWAKNYINSLGAQNYVNGVGNRKYTPNAPLTRAQFVRIIYNAFGNGDYSSPAVPFKDCASGMWYTDALNWAYANGIINGYSPTTFGPGDNITREQMAALIVRAAEKFSLVFPNVNTQKTFNDDGQIAAYARDAIYVMQKAGIIEGKPGNIFDPKGSTTRGEMAKVMYFVLDHAEMVVENYKVK